MKRRRLQLDFRTNTRRRVHPALVSGVALIALLLSPAAPSDAGTIRWRNETIETGTRSKAELTRRFTTLQARGAERRVVMQFTRPLAKPDLAALEQSGIHVLNFLGSNAYFVHLDREGFSAERSTRLDFIADVLDVEPRWKLHPFLLEGRVPDWAITDRDYRRAVARAETQQEKSRVPKPADPLIAVYVLFHPDVPLMPMGYIRTAMHGGNVISPIKSVNGLVIELPYSRIGALATEGDVQYIEPALPRLSELNNSSRARVGADIVQAGPYNLDGTGVTVLVYDSGTVQASHPDFGGRVNVRDSVVTRDHSTHVAGTLAGDGTQSGGLYAGMAPGVIIESYGLEQPGGSDPGLLFSDPGDLEADYDDAINVHGADIANNSIGSKVSEFGLPCEWTGDYGVTASLIDAIVQGSLGAPMRVVWSNGNERDFPACGDSYKTTAPPACAKNHITVGAVNSNNDTMTSFSSWGPCDDGRIKPDLVAPGCQTDDDFAVTSTSVSGNYGTRCGTSMSAPVVTGIGALLLEDFRVRYPAQPDFRNSTLKTLLAHTAVDLGNPGPDYQFGYGSVRAQPAVDQLRSGSFLETDIDQGEVFYSFIEVPPATPELKVTIAWDDAPGTPNVLDALVNDLDLLVIAPGEIPNYPWTLDPSNPALPAVRTTADRINNIEQVVIDSPPAGVYRIEVRGFSVVAGPQTVSLVATPDVLSCTSLGNVALDFGSYQCEDLVDVQVIDCDLNTNDLVTETVTVNLTSESEPGGESLLLTETAPDSATFVAVIALSVTDAIGVLQVTDGDTITATYIDADDGSGGMNVPIIDTAIMDCVVPMATSVQVIDTTPSTATIQVDLTEPAQATLNYGADCLSLGSSVSESSFLVSHTFVITGLADDTTYSFEIELTDPAGNTFVDDNGGACHSFKTALLVETFTELFDQSDFDLDNSAIVFVPNGSPDFYSACRVGISGLPVDTTTATTVLMPDDLYTQVMIGGGMTFPFYGVNYASLYIGSNGYITFGAGDATRHESFPSHFNLPRIAALFDDLNPSSSGRTSWEQLSDRMVVTFEDVPRFNTTNSNTFQFELFFTGEIRVTWFGIDVTDALVGISEGMGVPADFVETNLTSLATCDPRYPDAQDSVVQVINVLTLNVNMIASDDGLPDPPNQLSRVVVSLPSGELRDASDNHLIVGLDLPYTLNSGNTLLYTPPEDFVGQETIAYFVDDGGAAPTAGASNRAKVLIDVVAPIVGDSNLDGTVNIVDLLQLLAEWGVCFGCISDFDDNNVVNVVDLLALLANWGKTIPPPPPLGNGNSVTKSSPEAAAPDALRAPPGRGTDEAQDAFVNDGILAPADDGGVIEIDRDFIQTARGELMIEVYGTLPVDDHDLLVVHGGAQLAGGLSISAFDEFQPRLGDRFIVLVADSIRGEFEWSALPPAPEGTSFVLIYEPRALIMTLESSESGPSGTVGTPSRRPTFNRQRLGPPIADVDGDGFVTLADVARLLDEWGRSDSPADLNGDRKVDGADLRTLLDELID